MLTSERLVITEGDCFSPSALSLLKKHFHVSLLDSSREELIDLIRDADYIWIRLKQYIDRKVLQAAPKLKAIATNTTGLTHIDLDVADELGVAVISLRGDYLFLETIRATAEHTIALTLAALRAIPSAHEHVIKGGWSRDEFRGFEIFEKTVGIVGYGRLGRIVANYFKGMGANLVISDPKLVGTTKVDGCQVLPLSELLAVSDIVTLHANLTRENMGFFGEQQFKRMKQGSFFVNTARGELVNEQSLIEAIRSNHLGGVALDVVAAEHFSSDTLRELRELALTCNRIVLTPHIGGNTCESTQKTEDFLAAKLVAFANRGKAE